METENIKLIGDYEGTPVYWDKTGSDINYIWRMRGPIPDHKHRNQPGIVYMNYETGKITLPSGETWVTERVDYETKGYFVATPDIEEAIELLKKSY